MKNISENDNKIEKANKRPQSSASSPKLFFNYKSNTESHVDE